MKQGAPFQEHLIILLLGTFCLAAQEDKEGNISDSDPEPVSELPGVGHRSSVPAVGPGESSVAQPRILDSR